MTETPPSKHVKLQRGLRAFAFGAAWRQAISKAALSSASLKRASVAHVQPRRPHALSRAEKASEATAHLSACSSGREFDVGGAFIRRERREGDAGLEGAAIKVRIFSSPLERERDAAEQGGVGHRRRLHDWLGEYTRDGPPRYPAGVHLRRGRRRA